MIDGDDILTDGHIVLANFSRTEYPLPWPPRVAVKASRADSINLKFLEKTEHTDSMELVDEFCDMLQVHGSRDKVMYLSTTYTY